MELRKTQTEWVIEIRVSQLEARYLLDLLDLARIAMVNHPTDHTAQDVKLFRNDFEVRLHTMVE